MAANRSTKRHNAAAASIVAKASRASDHGRVAMQSHPNSDSTLGLEFGAARLCKPHGSLRQPTHTRAHARGDELDVLLRPSLSETQTKHKVHASFKTTCICRGNMLTDAFDISSLHLYYHGSPTTAPNKNQGSEKENRKTHGTRSCFPYNRRHARCNPDHTWFTIASAHAALQRKAC